MTSLRTLRLSDSVVASVINSFCAVIISAGIDPFLTLPVPAFILVVEKTVAFSSKSTSLSTFSFLEPAPLPRLVNTRLNPLYAVGSLLAEAVGLDVFFNPPGFPAKTLN